MKKMIVVCWDHLDPVWRRGFERQFVYKGAVIRPYADVEEFLFDRWMDIVENSKLIYGIEESLTVKKYLERNPDKKDRFAKLVREGKIELLGGGETLIDSNLTDGESIVRNHVYSILWYRDNFGVRPAHATLHDTFGMSAQLPQILRKSGYNAVMGFTYIGRNEKPYWKGLDGELIYFAADYEALGLDMIYTGKGYKIPVCPACLGKGCRVCNRTGLDHSHARMDQYALNESRVKEFAERGTRGTVLLVYAPFAAVI